LLQDGKALQREPPRRRRLGRLLEGIFEPAAALVPVAAHVPEPAERSGEAKHERRLSLLAEEGERSEQVVVLALEAGEPGPPVSCHEMRRRVLGKSEVVL